LWLKLFRKPTEEIGSDQAPRAVLIVDECFAVTLRFFASLNITESNMKERELNRANIGVAKTTAMSGRATANAINRCLRTGKERSFGRIASLTILRSLIAAGFVVGLAPMLAQADEEERGRDKKFEALEAKVESLQATVSALESQIDTLQASNTTLQNEIKSLKTSNATLQSQLTAVQSNHALLLGSFVSVDPNPEIGVVGPNITFSGANIHIVSGSGMTNDNLAPTGLGNLIIGYDEDPVLFNRSPLNTGDRGGSHNLVIGSGHRFTKAAFGGLLAGELNTISNLGASVSGGLDNIASGFFASVSGGLKNTAIGEGASVSGGLKNTAIGEGASVSGGLNNTASGFFATVSGGSDNFAAGSGTVVLGGQGILDNKDNSIAPQPPFP
jgi:FtsZ-binding cell division protein ZapB